MDREARLQKLVPIEKTYRRMMFTSSVLIFGAALYFLMNPIYSGVIAVVSLVPTVFLEWRKTRTYLQFNDEPMYRRLIRLNFSMLCFTFVLLFGLVALFLTGHMNRDGLMWAMVIGAPPSVLWPFWVDRKLLQLDPEHVTSSMLAKANREQLKRRLDGIND
ncbi:hypothetical protein EVJ32_10590 [Exiguobacterium sp. SH5S4]|uniref:hypothetical protein n=1 Tax=Exiguobacterium sp. SH5S4 TaxID=2510961 RepID=UPI00103F0A54|nr:hypothetical protein [Exiguobacterium sp. SH5S4]TCI25399.1 hypothetical protein EVJ32_10590 [Exiguobacterium sp. SH5S4]